MKNICLFLILLSTATLGFSQHKPGLSYNQLKQYEGLYEYKNHITLKIAASPADTALFAIINKSQYRLTYQDKDLFLDMFKNKIEFIRNRSNKVVAYITGKDTFKLLTKNILFPRTMWYPRLGAYKGISTPENLHDGLQTGDAEKAGLDTALLNLMVHNIAAGKYPNVHSVLIIKGGKLVFEEYFYEYTRDSLQELRSASKSFISALTGIAIEKGYIKSKNEKVLSYFPEYNISNMSAAKSRLTIENMLTNQSGFDYDAANPKSIGNEVNMGNAEDWVKYTLDLPMIDTPGGKGMYNSGNPITLGRIIEKATQMPLPQFANQNLFKPMGIKTYKWNFKPNKVNADDFCQLYLSPRNMAKFGLLYLDNGKWNGKQLVPESWVTESLTKHSVVQGVNYGYLWWLKYLDADKVRYYGAGAQGNGGQKIYIWKSLDMVTVVTGGNYNSQSPSDELIRKYILPSFNNKLSVK
ncbi:serine hydrolase domain-containing protein [Mucilaginibacter sp.]|uniref:serine hydrolase domain-containing protein n=1 Tax=Mucilaginibacter sp. TaxID=1882438 RepID=UPI003D0F8B03